MDWQTSEEIHYSRWSQQWRTAIWCNSDTKFEAENSESEPENEPSELESSSTPRADLVNNINEEKDTQPHSTSAAGVWSEVCI